MRGDALVGGSEAALEVGTALVQPALDDGRRLPWGRWAVPRKAPPRSVWASSSTISRSPPMVLTGWRLSVMTTRSAAKVAGLEDGRAAGSATARPRVRQPDANLERDAACRVPSKLIRASSQTRSRYGSQQTMRIATAADSTRREPMTKRRPKPPLGSRSRCGRYSRPIPRMSTAVHPVAER